MRYPLLLTVIAFQTASTWAGSITISGVGNFHQVDEHVYRGAQPAEEGFHNLAKLGVKVVVDLRELSDRSHTEERLVTAEGMRYVGVPMNGMGAPSNDSVLKVLDVLENLDAGPVFVHCMRGADRTGTVIASYRVEHDHWENAKALAEARSFGMSRFEKGMQHYVLSYHPRLNYPGLVQAASPKAPAEVAAGKGAPQ